MSVIELLGSVLTELEEVHKKLDRLLASKPMVAVMDSPERVKEIEAMDRMVEMDTKEEEDMDLSSVVLLKETDKAFLAFKKSMQVWVAKSHLDGGYDVGNTYDLKVKEKSKWILDKLDWKPFEVFKG